jgi:hypothetical protein
MSGEIVGFHDANNELPTPSCLTGLFFDHVETPSRKRIVASDLMVL